MKRSHPVYEACLFDFDYTLGDSTNGIVLCVNAAMGEMGMPACGVEAIRKTIGLTLPETFVQLTDKQDDFLCARFAALFKEKADVCMTANTGLFPDTVCVLRWLKGIGVRTGIVTTKFHYRIDEILDKYRIPHLIDIVVGSEDVKHAKPDPEGLLAAISELGIPRERALYIGDSLVDARTACNTGVDFAAVTTGVTSREAFTGYPYRSIVSSLSDLMDVVTP
jgi:phosphoglycolate phosphatase